MSTFLPRLLLLVLCTLAPAFGVWAQDFPLDPSTGKIYYAEEVLVKDGPKTDLYNRARSWLTAVGVCRQGLLVADVPNGVLIARTYLLLPTAAGSRRQPGKIWHTIKIEVEDDRYWYSLYDFQVQQATGATKAGPAPTYPLENLRLAQKPAPGQGHPKAADPVLAGKARQSIAARIASLKAAML